MNKSTLLKFLPAIIVLCVLLGMLIGSFLSKTNIQREVVLKYAANNKVDELLGLIEMNYVDTVNMDEIIEDLMPDILAELDPHSTYIPAKDLEASNADLKGSFSGIGIQFTIQQDTIHVNSVIRGGPSEKVGLLAGDRIVTIDDSLFVGKKINNNEAMKRLKGPEDSEVKLGIKRRGEKELLSFTIIRGNIPVKSVDAAYLIDKKYGYIKLNKFGETTFSEFMIALAKFTQMDFKGLIIDLRDNQGGYLGTAIQIANEFLKENDMIVYTKGEHQMRYSEFANGMGNCQGTPLIVLTDETSASASEILAGTIQDNDRGTIIGRRSFGKGLVQQPFEFTDGSAVRLTIARYYTPSGRCIQKPYVKGDDSEYQMDIITRYEHGEFFSQDSIRQNDTITYKTVLGRTVYGGGGIMPDIFIPSDTTGFTSYYSMAASQGHLVQFSFYYTDTNREVLSKYTTMEEMLRYLKTQPLLETFIQYASTKGLKPRNNQISKSKDLLNRALYAYIIYDMLNLEEHLKFLNLEDPTVLKAVEVLRKGEAFPKAPVQEATE